MTQGLLWASGALARDFLEGVLAGGCGDWHAIGDWALPRGALGDGGPAVLGQLLGGVLPAEATIAMEREGRGGWSGDGSFHFCWSFLLAHLALIFCQAAARSVRRVQA